MKKNSFSFPSTRFLQDTLYKRDEGVLSDAKQKQGNKVDDLNSDLIQEIHSISISSLDFSQNARDLPNTAKRCTYTLRTRSNKVEVRQFVGKNRIKYFRKMGEFSEKRARFRFRAVDAIKKQSQPHLRGNLITSIKSQAHFSNMLLRIHAITRVVNFYFSIYEL